MSKIEVKSWERFWMESAIMRSTRTKCKSRAVGVVIVLNNRDIAYGYNGPSCGMPHPETCKRQDLGIPSGEQLELCGCIHAEQNAIANAARHGISLVGARMYTTNQPCWLCMGQIVSSGILSVVYKYDYPSPETLQIAKAGGVTLIHYTEYS